MSLHVYIERLVIDGGLLTGEHSSRLQLAIERDLATQLGQPGTIELLQTMGSSAVLPTVALPPAASPHDRLGPRIATAIQHGLGLGMGGNQRP